MTKWYELSFKNYQNKLKNDRELYFSNGWSNGESRKNDFLFARLGYDISVLLIPRRVCTIATVTIPVKEATIFKTKSRMLTSLRFKQMLAG